MKPAGLEVARQGGCDLPSFNPFAFVGFEYFVVLSSVWSLRAVFR